MTRALERRLTDLEATTRTRVAVVKQAYPDEPKADALARHLATHPEDQDAELTVFIRKFT